MNLKKKLLIVFLLITFLPIISIMSLGYLYTKEHVKSLIVSEHSRKIEHITRRIELFMQDDISLVTLMGELPPIMGITGPSFSREDDPPATSLEELKQRCAAIFSEVIESNVRINHVKFVDAAGREVVRVNRVGRKGVRAAEEELKSVRGSEFFKETIGLSQGETYVSDIQLNKTDGKIEVPYNPIFRIAKPVFNKAGEPQGIVVAVFRMVYLFDQMKRNSRVGEVIITDQEGNFIIHPDEAKQFSLDLRSNRNYFQEQPELKENISKLEHKDHFDEQEKEFRIWRKIHFDPLHKNRFWLVFSVIQEDEFLAPIHRMRNAFIVTGSIGLIIMWLVSSLLSRSITEPLQGLEKTAQSIADGNLNIQMDPKLKNARGEVASLAKSFETMTQKLIRANLELERKVKERTVELKKAVKQLERSNEELQHFAYVASHDLQEPLRMIASYTQLLAKRYEGKLDKNADEYIAFAVDGAQRMKKLINDLLAYSRVDSKGVEFEKINSYEACRDAIDNLKIIIEEKGARIHCDPLPVIVADKVQMTQVFQNLIGNALKFCTEEDPIIRISCQEDVSEWVFTVKDNGIGIDEKYQERIFVIFERLHTQEQHAGTGIGLAISKKIIERHGGRIWFESAEGKGAILYFTVPKREV